MKILKKILAVTGIICTCGLFMGADGCEEADKVSYNLAQEADNFNVARQVTVIDCITGDNLLQFSGRCSIKADRSDNQLEVVIEDQGRYKKVIVGLSDNSTYIVEDLEVSDVSKYHYTINFNPKMWLPVAPGYVD